MVFFLILIANIVSFKFNMLISCVKVVNLMWVGCDEVVGLLTETYPLCGCELVVC